MSGARDATGDSASLRVDAGNACFSDGLRFAFGFVDRLRGLHALPSSFAGVLVLAPCQSIHTWGMKGPIDVAFIGKDGTVLDATRGVGPSEKRSCTGAAAVIERHARKDGWPRKGQRIRFGFR